MPIKLIGGIGKTDFKFDKDALITTASGKAAGKLKSTYGTIGLGLMRLDVVKSASSLTASSSDGTNVAVEVDWPTWWSYE